jgi:pimeloyl-ACP methyl ester carboxylesterase
MTSLNYIRVGSGEPLLLIHPLGADIVVWEPVLERLATQRDVIAVDMPGFGASPALANGSEPTPTALAAAIGRFLDSLGLERVHVAGNSLGGWVAFELAKAGRALSATGSARRASGPGLSGRAAAPTCGASAAACCRWCRRSCAAPEVGDCCCAHPWGTLNVCRPRRRHDSCAPT